MLNAQESKDILTEILDLLNRQKDLINILLENAADCKNGEKFLADVQEYLKTIDTQEGLLIEMGLMTQNSIYNDALKSIQQKK